MQGIEQKMKSETRSLDFKFILILSFLSTLGGISTQANDGIAFSKKETQLRVPGLVVLTVSSGTFLKDQLIKITKTTDKETADDFQTSISMYPSVAIRTPYEIRVDTGKQAPIKPIRAELDVPEAMSKQFQKEGTIGAFIQFFYDGENETLDNFESVQSSYNPQKRTVVITLEPKAFTNLRSKSKTFETIIVLAGVKPQGNSGH